MPNQEYDQDNQQFQQGQTPNSRSDDPRHQASGMPDTQRDQTESYDEQNSPEGWSPSQQAEGMSEHSDDAMRSGQPERPDRRQGSGSSDDDSQEMDADYGKGITGGQWNNQSDQDY